MYRLIEAIKNTPEYNKLLLDKKNNRLYHGYIIEGSDESFVNAFTDAFTMLLICEKNGCGQCDCCKKLIDRVHIDVYNFPTGGRKTISAKDDIEIFRNAYSLKPLEGETRVFIFDSGSSVRDDWQNKLLKSLEEPTQGNYIIIKTDKSEKLLPTIRSRSISIRPKALPNDTVTDILVSKGYDEAFSREAVWLFDGNYSLSEAFVREERNKGMLDAVFDMLMKCRSSRDCYKYIPTVVAYRDNFKTFCFLISEIFHKLLNYHCGVGAVRYRGAEFSVLATMYSVKACGEIIELIAEEKKKTEQNVMFQAIAEDLLLKIMEVKYRCRQ